MSIRRLLPAVSLRIPTNLRNMVGVKQYFTAAAATGVLTVSSLAAVWAASDITPPSLTRAALISATSQDISTPSGAYIVVEADISDDLSGMSASSELRFTSPSGNQSATGSLQQRATATGPNQWQFDISVPQYVETGVWTPTLTLMDASTNKKVWTHTDLMAQGWDLSTTLTGTSDTVAPAILSAHLLSGLTIDSSAGGLIEVQMTVEEALSGMSGSSELRYTSPSGKQTITGGLNPDGTGNLLGQVTVSQYAESGAWIPAITLVDAAGNKAVVTHTDLIGRGIDLSVTVSGTSDTTAPTITSLGFGLANPIVEHVPYGGAVVSIGAAFSDDFSGIGNARIGFTSPGGQKATGEFQRQEDGTYLATIGLPSYSQSGLWVPDIVITDNTGNKLSLNSAELEALGFTLKFGITKNVTKTALPGETVTSDEENDGATMADPVEASVSAPSGGDISIVIVASDTITNATNGYTFFDRQISISAPQQYVEDPLTISFQIDSSKIPAGEDETTLQVTRNSVAIPACTDSITASPDPCVFLRQRLADGDIKVGIHSTSASVWGSGFPTSAFTPSKYSFDGFSSPVENYGNLNRIKAGSTVPLKFNLGGDFGLGILAEDNPKSVQINCSTTASLNTDSLALSSNDKGLIYSEGRYQYNWQTEKQWQDTCRQLTFTLDDGTTFSALFRF